MKSKPHISFLLVVWAATLVAASLPASETTPTDGWKGVAQRDEIRPAFIFKKNGGPNRNGSLIIRADQREGLDGHWTKSFPVKGGSYYNFRAVRRLENIMRGNHWQKPEFQSQGKVT